MVQDSTEVVFKPLFKDNFNRYERALFPRQGGWMPGQDLVDGYGIIQGKTAQEGGVVSEKATPEILMSGSTIDDAEYASSSKSFKLEDPDNEAGLVVKRFSLPVRTPFCVSAENFAISAVNQDSRGDDNRIGLSGRERVDEREERRGTREESKAGRRGSGVSSTVRRTEAPRVERRSVRSTASGGAKSSQLLSGVPAGGAFYIYSFDGRLLAEYNLLGQLVRDYVYFGGQLVAEYRNETLYHYTSDQIGSTRLVTDYAGNVVYSVAHDPYGGIQKTWVTDFDPEIKFSGKPRDAESELDFFGPRYYDRSQFRLLSPNSISAGSGFAPASHAWNAYSYPGNHPWAETYVVAGWMVSATNIEAVIPYRPLEPEPEIPWWTVSYPWISRPEDSLWVLIKSSGEKRLAEERNWRGFRENWDKGVEAAKLWIYTFDPNFFVDLITISEGLEIDMWGYISGYEYGSDPVFDAILADYGMSSDPSNPLSYWNPCYVMYHLYYDF